MPRRKRHYKNWKQRQAETPRGRILDDIRRLMMDRLGPAPAPPADTCRCDECRIARARDVSENPRILQVQPEELDRIYELAASRELNDLWVYEYCVFKFGKPAPMLREIEAAAIIAHLERGDIATH